MSKKSIPKTARVLIVDDHAIVRYGLSQLIEHESDFIVCGEAESAQEALEAIEEADPDIIVVDLSLGGMSGLELIKNLQNRHPDLPALVLSMYNESLYVERALRAGARGFVMKKEMAENVLEAIERVLEGEIYISSKMATKILDRLMEIKGGKSASPLDALSDRELEVFHLIGEGNSTRDIAEKLCLSINTIETYRSHLKDKLNLKNATELVHYAIQWKEMENRI